MNIQREEPTFLWYDLETFGLNSHFDRIAQFAAIRTTLDFEPIGDELVYYCKPSSDYLPNVEACLVTGITPQECEEKGMIEERFIKKINDEFSVPNTIVVGFNSIKFDDEFIRNALYRNLEDPYKREYSYGCSRWDILPLIRATHDLRPEGITWPERKDDGTFSFRLTELTEANKIEQIGAHDALVDVRATIAVAKLVKEKQPKLFNWSLNLRKKYTVLTNLAKLENDMIAVCDTKFTSQYGCTTLAHSITDIPSSSNVFMFDLTKDVQPLIDADVDSILDVDGLFHIAVNKSPFISPSNVIKKATAERLNLDLEKCKENAEIIKNNPQIINNVIQAVANNKYEMATDDADFGIYNGFFSNKEKYVFEQIKKASIQEKFKILNKSKFEDDRSYDLVYRYINRNFEAELNAEERKEWKTFCKNRIKNPPESVENNLEFYVKKIGEYLKNDETSAAQRETLHKLQDYGIQLLKRLDSEEL